MPVPRLAPMLAQTGDLPGGDGWAFEPKWDGMRVVADIADGVVRLRSRSDRDVTAEFPELIEPLRSTAPCVVLDGEVVHLDESGRPNFQRLQSRFGVTDAREAQQRAAATPVVFIVFDLLHLDGIDAWRLPYEHRRALLVDLVSPSGRVMVTPSYVGDGQAWLDAARDNGLEGLMAKRLDHPYEPGRRSAAWRKLKFRRDAEFVVVGWHDGRGARRSRVGALVLACSADGGWRWVGHAGSGLTDDEVEWWTAELRATEVTESPFSFRVRPPGLRDARWVEPRHVVQVAFADWSDEGRVRHPVVLGRRPDREPSSVCCDASPEPRP